MDNPVINNSSLAPISQSPILSRSKFMKNSPISEEMRLQKELDSSQRQIYKLEKEVSILNSKVKYTESFNKNQKFENIIKAKDLEIEEIRIESNAKDRQIKLLEKTIEAMRTEKNKLIALAEEIAKENEEIKTRRLRVLSEENDSLRKNLASFRADLKKKDRVLIDLQEKLAFYENAYKDVTQKFNDFHFKKLEKLLVLHLESPPGNENEAILTEKDGDLPKNEQNEVGKTSVSERLRARPKEGSQSKEHLRKKEEENHDLANLKKEIDGIFTKSFLDFKEINEEVVSKLVNSLKILKSSFEFLYAQHHYDSIFLKRKFSFLAKDNEALQANTARLEILIEEKSKEIEQRSKAIEGLTEESRRLANEHCEKEEALRKNHRKEIEEITRNFSEERSCLKTNIQTLSQNLETKSAEFNEIKSFIDNKTLKENGAVILAKIIINPMHVLESSRVAAISSVISDGSIAFLQISVELPDGTHSKIETFPDFSPEPQKTSGISSSFLIQKSDSIAEIQAFYDKTAILQLTFLTRHGMKHSINDEGILSRVKGEKKSLKMGDFQNLQLCPIWTREGVSGRNSLYDLLFFDPQKRVFLFSLRNIPQFKESESLTDRPRVEDQEVSTDQRTYADCEVWTSSLEVQDKEVGTVLREFATRESQTLEPDEIEPMVFSDKELFSLFPNKAFRISNIKVWLEEDKLYGLRFYYENIKDKSEKIEGKAQVSEKGLSKKSEEKKVDGVIAKFLYQVEGQQIKNLVVVSDEEGEGIVKTTVAMSFGNKIEGLEWKTVELKGDNCFLKTEFEHIPGEQKKNYLLKTIKLEGK